MNRTELRFMIKRFYGGGTTDLLNIVALGYPRWPNFKIILTTNNVNRKAFKHGLVVGE